MATDPTQSIQEHERESSIATDLRAVAERAVTFAPSTDVPIVTVTLDWRIEATNPGRSPFCREGTRPEEERYRSQPNRPAEEREGESARRRPARRDFEDRMDAVVAASDEHDAVGKSPRSDFDHISRYLDAEPDPAARGYYIVSCSAKGIFLAFPTGLPLPTAVTAAPVPAMTTLARASEDAPPFAVLLAGQRGARLTIVQHNVATRSVEVEGLEYPHKQQQGGWSQRRYQPRADEKVEAFARDVAEETRKELERRGVGGLVLAGAEEMRVALENELADSVKDRLIGAVNLDMRATDTEVVDAASPLIERAEREHEREAVQRVSDGVGASTDGVGGAEDVLAALQAGQVMTLVMNDDFAATGWAVFTMSAYGTGDLPTSHPLGGDARDLVEVDLREQMVRLAIASGAEVEILHTSVPDDVQESQETPRKGAAKPRSDAALALDRVGGVGAILRYVVGDEPTEQESAAQAQDEDRQ